MTIKKISYMLIGHYGGTSFSDYCEKIIKKSTFKTVKEFSKIFLKLFKLLKNIFLGIRELNKNNIITKILVFQILCLKINNVILLILDPFM